MYVVDVLPCVLLLSVKMCIFIFIILKIQGLVYSTLIIQSLSPIPNLKFDANQEFSSDSKYLACSLILHTFSIHLGKLVRQATWAREEDSTANTVEEMRWLVSCMVDFDFRTSYLFTV